jgi:hypothetical protein
MPRRQGLAEIMDKFKVEKIIIKMQALFRGLSEFYSLESPIDKKN